MANINEPPLTVEQICAAMKNRGDFVGSYEDIVQTIINEKSSPPLAELLINFAAHAA